MLKVKALARMHICAGLSVPYAIITKHSLAASNIVVIAWLIVSVENYSLSRFFEFFTQNLKLEIFI